MQAKTPLPRTEGYGATAGIEGAAGQSLQYHRSRAYSDRLRERRCTTRRTNADATCAIAQAMNASLARSILLPHDPVELIQQCADMS